jgi:hypothetical protein
MKQYNFQYQGYDCVVYDNRNYHKPFIQLTIFDPNFPDRARATSIMVDPDDTSIPDNSNLVNYMLAQDTVKDMLDRLMRDGFPTSYDEEQV